MSVVWGRSSEDAGWSKIRIHLLSLFVNSEHRTERLHHLVKTMLGFCWSNTPECGSPDGVKYLLLIQRVDHRLVELPQLEQTVRPTLVAQSDKRQGHKYQAKQPPHRFCLCKIISFGAQVIVLTFSSITQRDERKQDRRITMEAIYLSMLEKGVCWGGSVCKDDDDGWLTQAFPLSAVHLNKWSHDTVTGFVMPDPLLQADPPPPSGLTLLGGWLGVPAPGRHTHSSTRPKNKGHTWCKLCPIDTNFRLLSAWSSCPVATSAKTMRHRHKRLSSTQNERRSAICQSYSEQKVDAFGFRSGKQPRSEVCRVEQTQYQITASSTSKFRGVF